MGVDIQTYRAKIGTFRHSSGADVVTLVLVVNFSQGLKAIGSVLFIGILLMMAGIESNPGPTESENTYQKKEMKTTKVKVTGFMENLDRDVIILFLEEKSGSKVQKMTMDNDSKSAIIEFLDSKAVDAIMQQLPLNFAGSEISVETYGKQHFKGYSDKKQATQILVTGLPIDATAEHLISVLENRDHQGGGRVKDVKVDTYEKSAIVEFEEASGWKISF
ncbi:uncharacterized protein LOC128551908 [Mercenaria mercenaria]|uniref:uncharacterized protein LOC128551908 n=1 Tax=Mercenaria mercenaria TaxID=6596 RepID=UPI00234F4F30|nr:uncharacterized protein LOC128551908 [Mercenaria mercenaria]